ncbi:MAG: hypothetical protein ACFB6R_07470 [Alphaproteobacteria bacterium]
MRDDEHKNQHQADFGRHMPDSASPLARGNRALVRRAKALLHAASLAANTAETWTDDDARRVADLIRSLQDCARESEGARRKRKDPVDVQAKAIQAFFKGCLLDPLDKARQALEARMVCFLRTKPDDARRLRSPGGAIVSAQADWTVIIDHPLRIDLNRLRDCFGAGEIERAVRRHVQRSGGGEPLDGVTVSPTLKVTVR